MFDAPRRAPMMAAVSPPRQGDPRGCARESGICGISLNIGRVGHEFAPPVRGCMIAGNREGCMEDVLLVETRGAIRLLTLNRPKKLNALNADLIGALTDALHAVQHDDSVAAVI